MDLEKLKTCVHCGLCLEACPTYRISKNEADSPRGRIVLMRGIAENRIKITTEVFGHLDSCLDCRACETICPAGVSYGELIERARMETYSTVPESRLNFKVKKIIFAQILGHPSLLKWIGQLLRLYQKSGIQLMIQKTQILKLLPESLRKAEALLPEIPSTANLIKSKLSVSRHSALHQNSGEPIRQNPRISLFRGCAAPVLFPQIEQAVAQLLSAAGCEVRAPQNQICCGALLVHSGFQKEALNFIKKNLEVFQKENPDFIITTAAGCGSWLKECSKFLPEAKQFSEKILDFSEVIHYLDFNLPYKPLPMRVVYLDACHLLHAQKIKNEPRQLLQRIPELKLLTPTHPDWCCGSAGIYNLTHSDMAEKLLDEKIKTFIELNPDAISVGNPGCALQIRKGLKERGLKIPILHPAELLQMSLRKESLLHEKLPKRC
ncbi:MAG: (Fe-S)-binding protein [Firmicutes bacterium]|nr:(Fe-S)-binding protein [Bacillota bacterium]